MFVDSQVPPWGPFGLFPQFPKNSVTVKLEGGEVHYSTMNRPHVLHSIHIKPLSGPSRTEKAYKYKDGFGQEWWSSCVLPFHDQLKGRVFIYFTDRYRYQLEAFIDKIQRRTPRMWISPDESISQMEWIENIYTVVSNPNPDHWRLDAPLTIPNLHLFRPDFQFGLHRPSNYD